MPATSQPLKTLLAAHAVEQLPWEDLHGVPGVRTKVLWRSGGSLAGILLMESGASLGSHAHPEGHHHVYIVEGRCTVGDEQLTEGAYVHIPAGEPHDIGAAGPTGCRLFYLYLGTAST